MRANTHATAIAGKFTVEVDTGCWLWRGATGTGGYGRVKLRGKSRGPHEVAFELYRGPIPPGLELDHIVCDTPRCINPWHVEPATHRANVMRGRGACAQNARRADCAKGHPLQAGIDYRYCPVCRREYQREYMRRRRAGARHAQ